MFEEVKQIELLQIVRSAGKIFEKGESIEYSGMAIVHLAADANIMKKNT